jgi:hypothetical protein
MTIVISFTVLLICLFTILAVLLIRIRKLRKIIQSNVDYSSKSDLLAILDKEINSNIQLIDEKEQIIAKLNSYEKELQSQIEELQSQIIDEKVLVQEYTEKTGKATQDYNLLAGIQEKLAAEVQQSEDRKALLETENADLSAQNSNLKLVISGMEFRIKTLKSQMDEPPYIKHIGYNPNKKFSDTAYPAVMMPQPNSVIKFPRPGRTGQHGFKEKEFETYLEHYFKEYTDIGIYNDRILVISDNIRPYEPDFSILDEKNNLLIDIEIDEPYNGYTGVPIHTIGQDKYRDQFFNNRGWMVIRFSEKQVHKYPRACCKAIAEIIASVNRNFVLSSELVKIKSLVKEEFWSVETAKKRANEGYREDYLGTGLQGKENPVRISVTNEQTQDEIETEKYVRLPESGIEWTADYNQLNANERDKRLESVKEPRQYTFGNQKRTIWASTLLKKVYRCNKDIIEPEDFYPKMHLSIHNYIQQKRENTPYNDIVFKQFLSFYNHNYVAISPYRTNWKIMDVDACILGTVDLLSDNHDGTFSIYNWKITDRIKENADFFNKDLSSPDIDEYNYVRYSMELNICKRILETNYNKPISKMYFVRFHPTIDSYQLFPVDIRNKMTDELFGYAKEETTLTR